MKKFILPILVLGLMMVAMPTLAAEYYAQPGVGDNDTCDSSNPCDFGYVVSNMATSGDVIYVAGDYNYDEISLSSSLSGTQENYTIIRQWEGQDQAVFSVANVFRVDSEASYISIEGIEFTESSGDSNVLVRGDYIIFDNCKFSEADNHGLHIDGGSLGVEVYNSSFYDNGFTGVLIEGEDVAIDHNLIYNNLAASVIQNNATEVVLSNNYIYNNSEFDINFVDNASSIDVYNNTFYKEEVSSSFIAVASIFTGDDINIRNNIFYNNDTDGLMYYIDASVSTFISDYNLYYDPNNLNSTPFYMGGTEYTFATWQAAGYDASSLTTDPLLTSTTSGSEDLHIQAISPAINAGTTITTITDDYDGDVRPLGDAYDIGADEYFTLSTPTTLTSTPLVTKATVSWDEVTNATSYNIQYGTSSDLTDATTAAVDTNTLELTGLKHGQRYYLQVQSVYTSGETVVTSDWSETATIITYPKKVKKSDFSVPKKTRKVKKAKVRIESMPARITGFNIIVAKKVKKGYNKVKTVKVSNKSAKTYTNKWVKGLKADTKYRIRIKARRKIGSTIYLSQSVATRYFTTK